MVRGKPSVCSSCMPCTLRLLQGRGLSSHYSRWCRSYSLTKNGCQRSSGSWCCCRLSSCSAVRSEQAEDIVNCLLFGYCGRTKRRSLFAPTGGTQCQVDTQSTSLILPSEVLQPEWTTPLIPLLRMSNHTHSEIFTLFYLALWWRRSA
jgi:hypothetical protein